MRMARTPHSTNVSMTYYLSVTGGFMEVIGNKVTILADACERSEEIDESRAQEAVERAEQRIASQESDLEM